ncbi:MAG TPA: TraR/DksA C4-type zinc finger protein [Gemmataceae bacterium]|nr:TraR/DksA C4-type zinc finger protein [Gemmataceae bacterium]
MVVVPRPCARCGAMIPAERIEAIPGTEVCITCSAEIGGEFKLIAVAEKTSKQGSLKLNYGGYTIKKVRKELRPKE